MLSSEEMLFFYAACVAIALVFLAFDVFRCPVCRRCGTNVRTKRNIINRKANCSIHGELRKKWPANHPNSAMPLLHYCIR